MSVREDLAEARFGDNRLTKRLRVIVDAVAAHPEESFPLASGDRAELEATYRFLSNAAVSPERILEPHYVATARRCLEHQAVIAVHDRSDFAFVGNRAGLGRTRSKKKGFFGHFVLAVALEDVRLPLGILKQQTFLWPEKPKDRRTKDRRAFEPGGEERLWWDAVEAVETRVGSPSRLVHVMDREADCYSLLARLVSAAHRFVIRVAFDRKVEVEETRTKLGQALDGQPILVTREVPLSARGTKFATRLRRTDPHPPRECRLAKLAFTVRRVRLLKTAHAEATAPQALELNVVRVYELDAPKGCVPVEWRLVTNEPIDTPEQVISIVDAYRARWMIEEYFKALKTGCAFEKRQLESKGTLLNALAIFTPIAWELLLLRALARDRSDAPASQALSPMRIRLLQKHRKVRLHSEPTVRDAFLAIAQLGGHIKNNGEPGWLVLGRGFEKLLLLEEGALLSAEM